METNDETKRDAGEAVDTRPEASRDERRGTRRIRLLRSILLGAEHAEEGSVHEVSRALAHRLIGEESAVAEDGGEPGDPNRATTVNRMEHATNREPEPRRISGPATKVKK
jgi:hypothetical protein